MLLNNIGIKHNVNTKKKLIGENFLFKIGMVDSQLANSHLCSAALDSRMRSAHQSKVAWLLFLKKILIHHVLILEGI